MPRIEPPELLYRLYCRELPASVARRCAIVPVRPLPKEIVGVAASGEQATVSAVALLAVTGPAPGT